MVTFPSHPVLHVNKTYISTALTFTLKASRRPSTKKVEMMQVRQILITDKVQPGLLVHVYFISQIKS